MPCSVTSAPVATSSGCSDFLLSRPFSGWGVPHKHRRCVRQAGREYEYPRAHRPPTRTPQQELGVMGGTKPCDAGDASVPCAIQDIRYRRGLGPRACDRLQEVLAMSDQFHDSSRRHCPRFLAISFRNTLPLTRSSRPCPPCSQLHTDQSRATGVPSSRHTHNTLRNPASTSSRTYERHRIPRDKPRNPRHTGEAEGCPERRAMATILGQHAWWDMLSLRLVLDRNENIHQEKPLTPRAGAWQLKRHWKRSSETLWKTTSRGTSYK